MSVRLNDSKVDLIEFDTQHDDEKNVNCYIASQSGKDFTFRVKVQPDVGFVVAAGVYLDGSLVDRFVIRSKPVKITGQIMEEGIVSNFRFSSLDVVDGDNGVFLDGKQLEDLGTLRVVCTRCHSPTTITWDEFSKTRTTFHEIGPIHEKVKKAGTHRTSLGDKIPTKTLPPVHVKYIDSDDDPYATFIFRYRPLEILQAQGIAPLEQPIAHANAVGAGNKRAASRTNATPGPSNAKRSRQDDPPNAHSPRAAQSITPDASEPPVKAEDVDGTAAAELDALLAERAALDARIREAEAAHRIKREPSPIVMPAGSGKGEVIDLTLE